MTENDADRQLAELRVENERLRGLLRQRGIEAADAALVSSRKDYQHERELATEQARTIQAEHRADAQAERADRALTQRNDLSAIHAALVSNTEFNRQILENSTDCIKVLDLEGRLEFMSAGGMRIMEIDDFSRFMACPWVEFWHGEYREKAQQAVGAAKAGDVGQFEGQTPTAKGNMRWWEVIVSPVRGRDGAVEKLLSISRDITARHEADHRQRVLFEEMHHRVKNTLTTIIGIVQQSFRNAPSMAEAESAVCERLFALGTAHDLLIRNEWISADLRDVVTGALSAYVGETALVTAKGDSLQLTSRAALTVAMLLNELATNAVKYGAWATKNGHVEIGWQVEGDELRFCWHEHHGPCVEPPKRCGFGTRLLQELLPDALAGTATLHYEPSGFIFELHAPVASLTTLTLVTETDISRAKLRGRRQ